MKFTEPGKKILIELINRITLLKNEGLDLELLEPTIGLLNSSMMLDESQISLQKQLVVQLKQPTNTEINLLIPFYAKKQKEDILICLNSLLDFFNKLLSDQKMDVFLNLVNFLKSYSSIAVFLDLTAKQAMGRINPIILWRLIFKILAKLEEKIKELSDATQFVETEDRAALQDINTIIFRVQNPLPKRESVYKAFQGCLVETESSLFIQGRFATEGDVLFVVEAYRAFLAPQPLGQLQSPSWNQYKLADHSLRQLARISTLSSVAETSDTNDDFKFVITADREMTDVSRTGGPIQINSSYRVDIFYTNRNREYTNLTADDHIYRLPTKLKLEFEEHVNALLVQMKNDPSNSHDQRREQKFQGLMAVINADNGINGTKLNPQTFYAAESGKPMLFLSFRSSKTEALFNAARDSLKMQLWRKEQNKAASIGRQGVSLLDESLRNKLKGKLGNLQGVMYEESDFDLMAELTPEVTREHLSGVSLWRYDKSRVLKILITADLKKCLHPALIHKAFISYPHYATVFLPLITNSEVEALCKQVCKDVLSQLWKQESGQNSDIYTPRFGKK